MPNKKILIKVYWWLAPYRNPSDRLGYRIHFLTGKFNVYYYIPKAMWIIKDKRKLIEISVETFCDDIEEQAIGSVGFSVGLQDLTGIRDKRDADYLLVFSPACLWMLI